MLKSICYFVTMSSNDTMSSTGTMSHVLLFFCLKKVLLSKKKVLLYALNNLNNFNENLSPHICTQNSTKEVYKYNYIYILL